MPSESDKWGWRHVSVFGDFDKGSGTKRWKCNHCNLRYNGSYSRVRAHLLGFTGAGVKSCPAIDRSLKEAFQILEEERVARKKKRTSRNGKPEKNIRTQQNLTRALKTVTREDVDDVVARFFYADGLNLKIVNSPYFHEMAKAISAFGPSYEPPSIDKLSDSFLIKEKARMEKAIALIKESWPHTACTIICVNRLDGMLGFFCINIFISSPRGLMFLKKVDINEGDSADILFTNVLSDVIMEVGPTNVLQVISHLGHASESFESLIVSKFPHIFWSPCTSHSIHTLMEDMAEMDWIKPVVLCAKGIEQCIQMFWRCSLCAFTQNSEVRFDPLPAKLAPSYCIVQKVFEQKQALKEVLVCEEWKQWKVTIAEDIINVETSILGNDFWERAHMLLQVFEPFVKLIVNLDIHKSVMGDVYFWWFQALEAVKCKGNDGITLDQLELLMESRWDILFSPLHATGYLLNPRYFGRGQTKDKTVMRGWKTTLERYKHDSAARRILREQLSSYCRLEGSLGEEDAVDCRDKMDPVAWWENFGFEIPHLQTLAIKILSQVPSDAVCQESWQHNDFPCRETANGLGVDRVDDLIFVQNNLKLQSLKHGNLKFASGQRSRSFCTPSGSNMRDGEHL